MKKLIAMILTVAILLVGCSKQEDNNKYTSSKPATSEKEEPKQETIHLTEHAQMEEKKQYDIIFDGELKLEVKNNYIVDYVAMTFETDEPVQYRNRSYIDGEFRYGNYVVKLDTITSEYYYMGVGAKDSFQLEFKGNQLRYWLRSNATLIINKIYLEVE